MKLDGKVAIVAGAGPGIGQGIVHCLAEEGTDVVAIDINGDNARKVADEVKALGRKALAIEADLTDNEKVTQVVQETIDTFGKIDILVNNVGGQSKTQLARTSRGFVNQKEAKWAEWDECFELNVKTHFLMSRAVVPYLIKQKSGKIVNISSISGRPTRGDGPYGAAKAADISLTRSLAQELAKDNINVNCICPGVIFTPFWEREAASARRRCPESVELTTDREYFDGFIKGLSIPLEKEQTPEDIGWAVVFLVSEDARRITGQALNVDGGLLMS